MKDLNKIVANALANDELVFVVRSRDPYSLDALQAYYRECVNEKGGAHEFTKDMFKLLQAWDDWQTRNRDKLQAPELPKKEEPEAKDIYCRTRIENIADRLTRVEKLLEALLMRKYDEA